MRSCDVAAPVDREQHFFLHMFSVGGVILPAGQMAEVCPHGRADRFQRFDRIAVFVDDRLTGRGEGAGLPLLAFASVLFFDAAGRGRKRAPLPRPRLTAR